MAATLEHDLNQERTAALGRGPRLRSPLSRWQLHIARLPRSGTAIDTLIYLTFFLLIGLPLGVVLVQAVLPDLFDSAAAGARFSLAPLARVFASPRLAVSVLNSLELAATVAVTATALGGLFAVMLMRCRLPLRGLIATVPWLVFLTPSYLKGLAWVLLMSPGGYLAQFGLLPQGLDHVFFALPGLVFVHTLSLFPLASFIIGGALAGLGSEFEDAARLAGARPLRIWLRITLPLLAPALALSAIATFAEVLSDFGLASTIARLSNFGVLTYGIYAAASDYPVDFPMAGSQSLVLLSLVLVVVLADRLLRRQAAARLISGRAKPARLHDLRLWRWPLTLVMMLIAGLALLLPLAAIALRAVSRSLGAGLAWDNFTNANIANALTWHSAINGALLRSLGCAALTALITCAFALLLSIRLDRAHRFMRPLVMALSLGAVAIPGIVLGFGYILVWNRLPGFRDWPLPHYGEASLLVLGYVAAAFPYCLVIIVTAVGQLAPNLADAARLFGVGAGRRLLRITLPLVWLSIVTAFLMTFIRTVFELPMSQMLIPLAGPPAPPVILKLFSHDQDGPAAALSLAAMIAAGGFAALSWLLAKRIARRLGSLPNRRQDTRGGDGMMVEAGGS
ncbi:MAG TPA: ABC transporter permease subunit [Terriglobia bacterium]|nr:ABC transporter permease subunit [Terriglobia bacterium]